MQLMMRMTVMQKLKMTLDCNSDTDGDHNAGVSQHMEK